MEEALRGALRTLQRPDFTFHVVNGDCCIRLNGRAWVVDGDSVRPYEKARNKPAPQVAGVTGFAGYDNFGKM